MPRSEAATQRADKALVANIPASSAMPLTLVSAVRRTIKAAGSADWVAGGTELDGSGRPTVSSSSRPDVGRKPDDLLTANPNAPCGAKIENNRSATYQPKTITLTEVELITPVLTASG